MGSGGRIALIFAWAVTGILMDVRSVRAEGSDPMESLGSPSTAITLGFGGFAQNLFKSVSVSNTASTSLLSTVFPSLMVGGSVPFRVFSERERMRFQLGFSPLGTSASDGDVSRRVLWVSPLLAHEFEGLSVHAGVCAWLTLYSSSRGTVTLRNGNSTDRYYIPSSGETTRVFAFQVGTVIPILSRLDFQADLLMAAPFSSDRRTLAAILSLQVPLWF